jgi:hypothetical protein
MGHGSDIYKDYHGGLPEHVMYSNIEMNDRLIELVMQTSDLFLTPTKPKTCVLYTSGTVTYALQIGTPVVT